jgi:hypothetical protein
MVACVPPVRRGGRCGRAGLPRPFQSEYPTYFPPLRGPWAPVGLVVGPVPSPPPALMRTKVSG